MKGFFEEMDEVLSTSQPVSNLHPDVNWKAMEAHLDSIYESMCDQPLLEMHSDYCARHNVGSMAIITQFPFAGTDGRVLEEVELLRPYIEGKRVVELGAGVGVLSLGMAKYAAHVLAIEADPHWSWVFAQHMLACKPPNLTWVYGGADSMADAWALRPGDAGVIYTRSNVGGMHETLRRLVTPEANITIGPLISRDWQIWLQQHGFNQHVRLP